MEPRRKRQPITINWPILKCAASYTKEVNLAIIETV